MRWIKASEQRPVSSKKHQRVFVKCFGVPDTILFFDGWWCWLRGEQVNDVRVREADWEDIVWLDESVDDKQDGWFDVKEKLPEIGEYVLVNISTDTILKGRLMQNGWTAFYMDGENMADDDDVTHWRYLPTPPTKKQ